MPLDLLRLALIDVSELVPGTVISAQQLVELYVDRQRIAMFCALDQQIMKSGANVAIPFQLRFARSNTAQAMA